MPGDSSRGLRPRFLACIEARANARRNALGVETDLGEEEPGVAMVDEDVGKAQMKQRDGHVLRSERLGNGTSRAASHDALLDRHDRVMPARDVHHEVDVEWL